MQNPNELFKKICSMMQRRPEKCKNLAIINSKEEILADYNAEWGAEGSIDRKMANY